MAQEQIQDREARMTIRDHAIRSLQEYHTSIRRSPIQVDNFEIDPAIIQIIYTSVMFKGLPSEDPFDHINNFLEICDTFKQSHVTDDAFRLRLFPFSLKDRAKAWLNSFPADYFTAWDDLAQKFLSEYFSPAKTVKLRQEIVTFTQFESEPLHEAWERFKELLRRCPHHGLPKWSEVQTFYNGLTGSTRTCVDIAAGGALMVKSVEEAYELLEEIAAKNYQLLLETATPRRAEGIRDIDAVTTFTTQVATLTKKLDILNFQQQGLEDQSPFVTCNSCGGGHFIDQCPFQMESTTYNSDWRNHTNISYENEQGVASTATSTPVFMRQQYRPTHNRFDSLEETMHQYMERTYSLIQDHAAILQSQAASLRALESQVSHLTQAINSRSYGALSSVTEINPRGRGIEQVKGITLKSETQQVDKVEPEKSQLQIMLNSS